MRKLRRDDEVIVIAGRDKGTRGTITRMMKDDKVIVAGVNMIKRHTRPNPNLGQPGGIGKKKLLCIFPMSPFSIRTGTAPTGSGIRTDEDGTKTRFFKSSGEQIN